MDDSMHFRASRKSFHLLIPPVFPKDGSWLKRNESIKLVIKIGKQDKGREDKL